MNKAVIGIVYRNQKSEVLLVKRRDVPMWVLPGGGVEEGESAEQAVIREIKEETGLVSSVSRKAAEYTPVSFLASDTEVFECAPIEGVLTRSQESEAVSFFPVNQLPKSFFYIHKLWMTEALINDQNLVKRELKEVSFSALLSYFSRNPFQVIRYFFSWIGMPINRNSRRS